MGKRTQNMMFFTKNREEKQMSISKNEYLILKLLWKEDRPLTRAQILQGTTGRDWNPASIHLILNSMISKGIIKITDESVSYGRTYEYVLSESDYIIDGLKNLLQMDDVKSAYKEITQVILKNKVLKKRDKEELMELLK